MFTPRGSPCFVFLRRRVHHHGSLVFALVLRLFARLACRPHDHGSRSTASASWRAPWWGRDRGFRHGYGCSVGAQPLAFRQRCWGSPRGHDGGGSEWYVANCARSWWIVVFSGGFGALGCPSSAPFSSFAAPCPPVLSPHGDRDVPGGRVEPRGSCSAGVGTGRGAGGARRPLPSRRRHLCEAAAPGHPVLLGIEGRGRAVFYRGERSDGPLMHLVRVGSAPDGRVRAPARLLGA